MIVPYSLIPAEYLEPLEVETTTEYTLEDDQFPGLNDDQHINQPALFVVPIHPSDYSLRSDYTTPVTEKSISTEQELQHDGYQLIQPRWVVLSIYPRVCEQGLSYSEYSCESIHAEPLYSLSSQRRDSRIGNYRKQNHQDIPPDHQHQQQHQQQRVSQQKTPNPRENLSALISCIDVREAVIDLTDSSTECSSSTSCNFLNRHENMTISADRRNFGILPKDYNTSRANVNYSQSGWYDSYSDYCSDCVYTSNEFSGQTVDQFYNEFLPEYSQSRQEQFLIENVGRKRVYPGETSEDSGITCEVNCPKRRRCETTATSVPYPVDYIALDLQNEADAGNSYTDLTNVTKFWNNEESVYPFQFGCYLRDSTVQPNAIRPPSFRQY